jgi:hypothetical protein
MGAFTVGGRTFEVKPATLGVAKRITIAMHRLRDASLASLSTDHLDALAAIFHAGLAPSNPELTISDLEDLIPAAGIETLIPQLLSALGLEAKKRTGEAVSP